MIIRFLCNAGISVEHNGKTLLIDLPNGESEPFYKLPDETWTSICGHHPPYSHICGFFFTHNHPDHLNKTRLSRYFDENGDTAVFIPDDTTIHGYLQIGEFHVEYQRFEHAPIPQAPPHVVAKITAGCQTIYVSGDSALNSEEHRAFLKEEKVDAAIWNSMYLSRPETRELMSQIAEKNFIYHMPLRTGGIEIWKKCEKNLQRYHSELKNVMIVDQYPMVIEI